MKIHNTKFKTTNKKRKIPQQRKHYTPEDDSDYTELEQDSKKALDIKGRIDDLHQRAIKLLEAKGIKVLYGKAYKDNNGNSIGFYDWIDLKHKDTRGAFEAKQLIGKLEQVRDTLAVLFAEGQKTSSNDYQEMLTYLMADMFSIVSLCEYLTAESYIDRAIAGNYNTTKASEEKLENQKRWLEIALPIYKKYKDLYKSGSQAAEKTMKDLIKINEENSKLSLKLPKDQTYIRKLLASKLKKIESLN